MKFRRRQAIAVGSATLAGLAGCLGFGGEEPSKSNTETTPTTETTTESEEPLELAFGDGAVFTDGEGIEMAVTMTEPRLMETVTVVRDSTLIVDAPASESLLFFASVRVSNEGESAFKTPGGLRFEVDGTEMDHPAITTPGKKYRQIQSLDPGESAEATVAFPAPADGESGLVELQFETLLPSPPARWLFDYDEVPRETTDLTGDGLGDPVTIKKGDYAYEFTPTDARVTDSYTYGDDSEHTAPAGSTFVLVEARAENTGQKSVKLPTPFEIRLSADGSMIRQTRFKRAEERYPGVADPVAPGETLAGTLLFEVPTSVSDYSLALDVGNETYATWDIEFDSESNSVTKI